MIFRLLLLIRWDLENNFDLFSPKILFVSVFFLDFLTNKHNILNQHVILFNIKIVEIQF